MYMTACLCQYTYSLVMRLSCTMCLKWSFTACIPLNHHTHTHRSHTYQFEDFLLSWGDKLKSSGEPNSITVRLQKDVDKFHVSKQFFFIAVQSFSCWYEHLIGIQKTKVQVNLSSTTCTLGL